MDGAVHKLKTFRYFDINFIGIYYSWKVLWLEYRLLWDIFESSHDLYKRKMKNKKTMIDSGKLEIPVIPVSFSLDLE